MRLRKAHFIILLVVVALLAGAGMALWPRPVGTFAERCRQAIIDGNTAEFARLSEAWTLAEPDNSEAWLFRAESAIQLNQPELASESLAHVRHDSVYGRKALENLIELQFGPLNVPLAAVESCKSLLALEPASKVAQQRLIFFYAFTLQRRQLIDQIREAVTRDSEPKEAYPYLFLADSLLISNAAPQNAHWLEGSPDSELFEVAQAIHIGEALEGQIPRDNPELAAEIKASIERRDKTLAALLEKYPTNIELLAWYLRQAIERGEVERVAELLRTAPPSAETDNRFWRFRGWLLQQHDDIAGAEAAYRQALVLNSLDSATRHLLAALLRRQGKLDEAGSLDRLVMQANELRRTLQSQPNMRAIPPQAMQGLAQYAAGCHDTLISQAMADRLSRYGKSQGAAP